MLEYSNKVNSKVAAFGKQPPHGTTNHLISPKKTKSSGKEIISHNKLYQLV